MAETGTRRLREDLEWKQVEPVNNSWNWSATDALYLDAAEREMTILPVLDSPPCWAVPEGTPPEDCEKTYPLSNAEYAEFAAHVASRYGPGGSFWEAHPSLDGSLASKQLEIWNEPYVGSFVNGVVDPAHYAALYKAAVVAGRAANPATRYLVESTVEVWDTTTKEWVDWAAGMVKAEPGIGNYIDGISIHPYPGKHNPFYEPISGTDESFKNTDRIYKDWKERGVNKPVWITEIGYSSCTDEERCVPGATQAEREAKKAEWLTELFSELGENQYGYVHAVYLYNFRQFETESPTDQSAWFGITNQSSEHRAAWTSFAEGVAKFAGVPAPDTTILGHTIEGAGATFTFSTTDASASLECQLDSGSWSGCTSPVAYSKLHVGAHTFKVRARNAEATDPSPASYEWSVAPSPLESMAVTEPFDESTSPISNFSSNWSALAWATSSVPKGEDTASGWEPAASLSGSRSGAFYAPNITDTGSGIAVATTVAAAPSINGLYLSIWLDMPSPTTARAGYELRFGGLSKSGLLTVWLEKWQAGVSTTLSEGHYAFANGDSLALADEGNVVSAWTNTGAGFEKILSAGDSTYAGGNSGVEGTAGLLEDFKVGVPLAKVQGMGSSLEDLPVRDSFLRTESPLSGEGSWAGLNWDTSTSGHNTGRASGGWGPSDAYPTVNGAYWQKASFADTGSGDAAAVTLAHNPVVLSRYFSVWLNMPNPASAHSGYELRFIETSSGVYEAVLSKWQSGTKTVLSSKTGYSFPANGQLALVDKMGTVSAWTKPGSEFTQLLSASDATFTSGYAGVEGSGSNTRLKDFKAGPLAPF